MLQDKMPKNGNTVRLDGRKHSVPRVFVGLLDDLEGLAIVESLGTGRWGKIRNAGIKIKIQYYNETTRMLKVSAINGEYRQEIFVQVNPDNREEVEEYVRNYNL